ncbi:protein of unknown function [Paraburkholderia dioscoreae]|uniref:PDZ domain-containing protein n=1 Tax=Paraburkholderia dioscoreae TaxID=2604047 RepID=A0A5Q4ZAR5_9BURK|nr:protein of unknown function [Paraburkholderia dioscoreae]
MIPIDVALDVKDQLLKAGQMSRGRLGAAVQEVSQSIARSFGLSKPDGALISTVESGGPTARAGLQAGDETFPAHAILRQNSECRFLPRCSWTVPRRYPPLIPYVLLKQRGVC